MTTHYLLFVMKVAPRTVHLAGCTTNPNEAWMRQVARNLTDYCDGFLNGVRYLITDRDGVFCNSFRATLEDAGVTPVGRTIPSCRDPPRN